MFASAGGQAGGEGEDEVGWHPSRRTSASELMRQGSHSSFRSHSLRDRPTQSGLLEQLMSSDDNGLQVTPPPPTPTPSAAFPLATTPMHAVWHCLSVHTLRMQLSV